MSSDREPRLLPLLGDAKSTPLPEKLVRWVENLPGDINTIIDQIAKANGGVWIVGGAVRDAFLGLGDQDIDLAVTLTPHEMLNIFPDALPTGIDYGLSLIHI